MIQKPKIQYIGQFYTHGSEARKLELEQEQQKRKAKTKLPDWESYNIMSGYVSRLKLENAKLTDRYRAGYDLDDIASKAQAMGLVAAEELATTTIQVTLPEPEHVTTWEEELVWFWNGLWA